MPKHNVTPTRPTLPPLDWVLFLPRRGTYIGAVDEARGRFTTTFGRDRACTLPDARAQAIGLRVVRALGEPVELRSPAR